MTREYYRIIRPNGYPSIEDDDLDNIKTKLKDIGSTPDNPYYHTCQARMLECEMVKVTEITTPIL
jgi:hypothetical protein